MDKFTLYHPGRELPPYYRGWPCTWRIFADPFRAVAMIGGTWYKAILQRDELGPHWKIEEVA